MISSLSACQDDECYEQSADVRSQLRFFEQLERIEKQRKDEQEREILLKAAKVSYCHLTILPCVYVCERVVMSPCNSVCLCIGVCTCAHVAPAQALTDELECDTSGWSDLPVSSQAPGPRPPLSWLFLPGHSEEGGPVHYATPMYRTLGTHTHYKPTTSLCHKPWQLRWNRASVLQRVKISQSVSEARDFSVHLSVCSAFTDFIFIKKLLK